MSCPWFYSENGSAFVAVGSTLTGNNRLFWVVSLKTLDYSGVTLVRTYFQSRQAELTVKRLRLNRNWLLTGLFPPNWAVQIQLSVSLKNVWGSKICATVQLVWSTSSYTGIFETSIFITLWLEMLSQNSDINDTFFRQSQCIVQCILPMQRNKITPKKCPRNFSIRSYNRS